MLGNNAEVLLVTGAYEFDSVVLPEVITPALSDISFTLAERLDLHQQLPEEHKPGEYYQPHFSEQVWKSKQFNPLLREIASCQTTAFFVSQRNACLVAPYDGGVDVLLQDEATRDYYKRLYRAWLSPLPSGL